MSTSERKVPGSLSARVRGSTPRLPDVGESPRTPLLRSISSTYGSPGSSFRTEDEYVVLDLGARFLRGGVPGESAPRCSLPFGPDTQRRVGDYRQWDPSHTQTRRKRKRGLGWGEEHELYRMDLASVDLGLVQDQFERAMREAYSKYFLLDTKPRRILLAMPPRMPHALMGSVLDVLFTSFQAPSITLMSNPVLSTVAAGLRSALVVDIGWAETVATAVCEYREVHERCSIRAGKMLSEEMAKLLNTALDDEQESGAAQSDISFEEAEEVLTRVAWCKPNARSNRRTVYFPAREAPVLEEFEDAVESPPPTITIPFPRNTPPTELRIPFASLCKPAENALFAPELSLSDFDDEDLPLHHLIYRTLVQLPIDVRRLCMSRIIITGGVSAMPGLKTRIQKELEVLVASRGWDSVKSYGKASAQREEKLRNALVTRQEEGDTFPTSTSSHNHTHHSSSASIPAAFLPHESDPIDEKLAKLALHEGGGSIRLVESLGAWAGGSLVAQQRVKGLVEIERERWLKEGLQGASREKEVSVIAQRMSMGPGTLGGKGGERASWTLGVWA
jgi:actin-related protein